MALQPSRHRFIAQCFRNQNDNSVICILKSVPNILSIAIAFKVANTLICLKSIYLYWSLVKSPHKGQWCGALMFSLICAWANGSANNRDAGDLRRHGIHYDVTLWTLDIQGSYLFNSLAPGTHVYLFHKWWVKSWPLPCQISVMKHKTYSHVQSFLNTALRWCWCQCNDCWWPSDTKSQAITSHDIDLNCTEFTMRDMPFNAIFVIRFILSFFTIMLMSFYCVFLIIYRSVIFCECICFYFTVSESEMIKLFNLYLGFLSKVFVWKSLV